MLPAINILAVLGCVVVSIILGYAWYAEVIFGGPWLRLMHKSKEEVLAKDAGTPNLISFFSSFVTYYILALLIKLTATSFYSALFLASILWLGFILAPNCGDLMFEDRRALKLMAMRIGYELFALLVSASILFIFR